jgi:hypothetical protein
MMKMVAITAPEGSYDHPPIDGRDAKPVPVDVVVPKDAVDTSEAWLILLHLRYSFETSSPRV